MNAPARPPVIILGGNAAALSVARSLAPLGVTVYGLGVPSHVHASRFVQRLDAPPAATEEDSWASVLLGETGRGLAGAVVLAASDVGLTVIARNRDALAERFLLDASDVEVQLCMLDKLRSYERAAEAGVPTPRFWRVSGMDDVREHRDEYVYPLIVKPILSHEYQALFPGKFRTVDDWDGLVEAYADLIDSGLEVMLVEKIEGPDSLLCSYYTYMDADGEPTYHFTKRIVRRYPVNMGDACYHVTDDNPEVAELARTFFRHVGLRGVANAEFKRDRRDGRLKLIECNARFTAANCLVAAAGLDLAKDVYFRIIGEPFALPEGYRTGLRLWQPSNDVRAFLDLRRRGELGLLSWLTSLAHPQTFAFFRWDDPGPAIVRASGRITRGVGRSAPARLRRRPLPT